MSLLWATGLLILAMPFALWPLLRPEAPLEPVIEDDGRERESARQAALLAIEEVELDEASGRLDSAEAGRRLAELRREAEIVLRRP